ncbi:UPF0146 family protein [Methanobrevibacter sp.]|uniref:UPF0146 family protein n=1 Tax=Methanobrevibacter sp. TaxID=66852 RepID=UPI0026E0C4FF|nr:UPF0146 family protein [Methanobrevibacter sp.]
MCEKRPVNIAEIGIGKFTQVYDFLNSQDGINVIKIDINPADEDVIKDDITNPTESLYENLDIIYSIRPPSEIHPYLIRLKDLNNAKIIIKPLFNEDVNTGPIKMKLKNYKKASFYIL